MPRTEPSNGHYAAAIGIKLTIIAILLAGPVSTVLR